MRALERIWYGTDALARGARVLLTPLEAVYALGVTVRGHLHDTGRLAQRTTALPALSVGNLSVGGTGKTPVTAWLAAELVRRGAHPTIVLRGYGDDEPAVHQRLNPEVPVIVAPDRVAGAARAMGAGADLVLFDDAFQHRRACRSVDLVVISADQWMLSRRLLPAGPLRETPRALRRATLVLVARKAVPEEHAIAVSDALARVAPDVPRVTAHLALGVLRHVKDGEPPRNVSSLAGLRVLAVSAIGNPRAFEAQLGATGARVRAWPFADHHAYTAADVTRIARAAAGQDRVVCTLKDAVKLAHLWPRQAVPLWYVSQQLVIERGQAVLDAAMSVLLDARHTRLPC